MQLTITEAAKLYGKQRKTLYRHISAGRLSCSVRGDGHRVIDLSELIRCYGEPTGEAAASDTEKTRDSPQGDTPLTHFLVAELVAINRHQSEQLEGWRP
ncbi:helix-turn-helix domain-containing protein [Vreelandella rituensis]|uniref:Helix-turn-helix domain-containing protein n=1 Tax=Vreelandella rituensis TaxID=2282306 RepID=A0A368TN57_9GAMM|nr:helix-turn-helix domain-containing protein [Halomonas rituensis]RCV86024.1 helix-turn-helix domain-containing protein [Halomonas rituensis]